MMFDGFYERDPHSDHFRKELDDAHPDTVNAVRRKTYWCALSVGCSVFLMIWIGYLLIQATLPNIFHFILTVVCWGVTHSLALSRYQASDHRHRRIALFNKIPCIDNAAIEISTAPLLRLLSWSVTAGFILGAMEPTTICTVGILLVITTSAAISIATYMLSDA